MQPAPAPAPAPRDPGLQPERTRLAWRRTTLSCAVTAGLAARQAVHQGLTPLSIVATALVALVWLGFLTAAHHRIRALDAARPPTISPRAAALAAGCTVALAAFGAAELF
ncbi:DUF202 domain-containing protein [Streptomyces sp. H27-D2]|uniref:DUF202 domain-containing protein n=1 Tax=Streptomyces sp. H27-D2 TaxID=3046304 RepID=UPI002DBC6250|nr:DUF202 domain-containing protein [Streptomyces sp. H27-D2]MEC4018572.1 DUF202 domain-containing protein [Streptomyces sp. H27-D2]